MNTHFARVLLTGVTWFLGPAIAWAVERPMNTPQWDGLQSQPLSDTPFITWDFETLGLHPVAHPILDIGAVRFQGRGPEAARFDQLVNPRCPIPPLITAITGITDEMVVDQPTIDSVLPRFHQFLGEPQAVLLAHNAGFDASFLATNSSRLRLPLPAHLVIDTCVLARKLLPKGQIANHKLETLGQHFGLIDKEAHRGYGDSQLLRGVFWKLLDGNPAITTTGQLFKLVPPFGLHSFGVTFERLPPGHEALWDAVEKQQPLTIQYQGGSEQGASRVITPHGLVCVKGQIYVDAHCHKRNSPRTFRLDRITRYGVTP
jgi:DNA polymerase III subunit epsilon